MTNTTHYLVHLADTGALVTINPDADIDAATDFFTSLGHQGVSAYPVDKAHYNLAPTTATLEELATFLAADFTAEVEEVEG